MKLRKELEKFANKMYEKTGAKMDIEASMYNLQLAMACESQRMNSQYPYIPVISDIEISDRFVFDGKLDNFKSDVFFFLKEIEEDFDSNPYPSSFYADDDRYIDEMIKKDFAAIVEANIDFLVEFMNTGKAGDKVRFRCAISDPKVNGKVARREADGEPEIMDTDEYVIVMEIYPDDEENPMRIFDVYPI